VVSFTWIDSTYISGYRQFLACGLMTRCSVSRNLFRGCRTILRIADMSIKLRSTMRNLKGRPVQLAGVILSLITLTGFLNPIPHSVKAFDHEGAPRVETGWNCVPPTAGRLATSPSAKSLPGNLDGAISSSVKERAFAEYSHLPIAFEANQGQADAGVKFLSRGFRSSLFFTGSETALYLHGEDTNDRRDGQPLESGSSLGAPAQETSTKSALVRMRLLDASHTSEIEGIDTLAGNANYFIGSDPAKWHANVKTFGSMRQQHVYPGIDLVYYGNQGQLEYDFLVAPGASSKPIALGFEGVDSMRLDEKGDIVLSTPAGEIRHRKPVAYQEAGGVRKEVAAKYEIRGKHKVGFRLGAYDHTRSLVIDPVLSYSSFLGLGVGTGVGIAVDSTGTYIAGRTIADQFNISTPGAFQSKTGPFQAVFVAKLNPQGSGLIYASLIGGKRNGFASSNGYDFGSEGHGFAVDTAGNVYVCGVTESDEHPTTPGAFQTTNHSHGFAHFTGFVTKLNPTGSGLAYSTYLGGNDGDDGASQIAVDSLGNAYVTGDASSASFPVTAGAFQTTKKGSPITGILANHNVFVTKLNPVGSGLVYSTFLGGSGQIRGAERELGDYGRGIAVDAGGNAYVTGDASSLDFPTTPGALQPTRPDAYDYVAFASKLDATGSSLLYSTFLSGKSSSGSAIAVDAGGHAYIVGRRDDRPPDGPMGPLLKTIDAGNNWTAAGSGLPLGIMEASPAIDPKNSSRLYAALSLDGLFRSTDGGNTWARLNTGLPAQGFTVASILINPVNTAVVYVGITPGGQPDATGAPPQPGLYKSTDGGASWTFISSQPDGSFLAIDSATPSTLYSSDASGPIKSVDSGTTWTAIHQGLPPGSVTALAVDPQSPSKLYLSWYTQDEAPGTGIYRSNDGGSTWTATSADIPVHQISVDPRNSLTIYGVSQLGDPSSFSSQGHGNPRKRTGQSASLKGVIKSVDGGTNWSAANGGLPGAIPALYQMAIDSINTSTVYLGTSYELFKSTDSGNSWVPFPNLPYINALSLATDPNTAGTLYVGAELSAVPQLNAFAIQLNPAGDGMVYSTTLGGAAGSSGGNGLALDSEGNLCVAGITTAKDFRRWRLSSRR
jgi:hypothetical protein